MKNYTITVNGNVYNVTVEEGNHCWCSSGTGCSSTEGSSGSSEGSSSGRRSGFCSCNRSDAGQDLWQ